MGLGGRDRVPQVDACGCEGTEEGFDLADSVRSVGEKGVPSSAHPRSVRNGQRRSKGGEAGGEALRSSAPEDLGLQLRQQPEDLHLDRREGGRVPMAQCAELCQERGCGLPVAELEEGQH